MAKDSFLRSVEVFKETLRYRQSETSGGWYSEADLKKPVSEGGCGFLQQLGINRADRS